MGAAWRASAAARRARDGTHLTALWSYFRDLSMLDPRGSLRVASQGHDLPSLSDLDAAVVAAAVAPLRYAALRDCCVAGFKKPSSVAGVMHAAGLSARLAALAPRLPPAAAIAEVSPADSGETGPRYAYLQTPQGRVHVRRAGCGGGCSLLMFHSPRRARPNRLKR